MTQEQAPICWTIRADRREVDLEEALAELRFLEQAMNFGLEPMSAQALEALPDGGAFRDFVPVATISSLRIDTLEEVAEELLGEFGFRVDFLKA